ncbi:2OG-Fe(II) oxygenase superfamily protein [Legionella birminghamensis]|uniref:2OG-Fe(II) oxygenase superfamily protein n=1 Tax=Legionella birminghamensis TaxID=28083 RepID=A0A378IDM3_9GAMM|nr:alpha-ketoglutarate-dependent dioxygenase AlkB [Legionella birminghamensis]KTC72563.1 2OG-Fe(II) oxygenase superfamily protein [Legionella birminghamensis]STX32835.1 alpha-ketoglutarate-dependent dioxygenase AlkB [Legionella birminghamensis]
MELSGKTDNQLENLLPCDGIVYYYGPVMPLQMADDYFQILMKEVAWTHDEAMVFGKKIITRRKVAWYAGQAFSYTYSQITKTALPWIPVLEELKRIVERESGETYNSCLLNLYHDGSEGVAWHSDGEKDLKKNGAIGSLSFGAERKFAFRHQKSKEVVSTILEHGSLLVMKGSTQKDWLHRLPPTKMVHTPRINLTFRTIESL